MCVKFQLSVSESSRDIKGILLSAGSVRLQTRAWHIWPRFRFSRQFPLLPLRGLDTVCLTPLRLQRIFNQSALNKLLILQQSFSPRKNATFWCMANCGMSFLPMLCTVINSPVFGPPCRFIMLHFSCFLLPLLLYSVHMHNVQCKFVKRFTVLPILISLYVLKWQPLKITELARSVCHSRATC